jgi:hypothetical protein
VAFDFACPAAGFGVSGELLFDARRPTQGSFAAWSPRWAGRGPREASRCQGRGRRRIDCPVRSGVRVLPGSSRLRT